MKVIEVKQVTIPIFDVDNHIVGTRKVIAKWVCPECGAKLSHPSKVMSKRSGQAHTVHVWNSNCKHPASYQNINLIERRV